MILVAPLSFACFDDAAIASASLDPALEAYIARWDIDLAWVRQHLDQFETQIQSTDPSALGAQVQSLLDDYRRWNAGELDMGVRISAEFPGGKIPVVLQSPHEQIVVTVNDPIARATRERVFLELVKRAQEIVRSAQAAEVPVLPVGIRPRPPG